VDNKAKHFHSWLLVTGFTSSNLSKLREEHTLPLLASYLHHIAYDAGGISKQSDLMSSSLRTYLHAAQLWLQSNLHLTASISDAAGKVHPLLSDILSQRKAWERPKSKREPFTPELFDTLASQLHSAAKTDPLVGLSLKATVFDWMRLGSFTGSRAGEYSQSLGSRKSVSRIPNNPGAGDWASEPIAFIASDFTFLSSSNHILSHHDAVRHPKSVAELHIRFRYDKSPRNCVVRKFRRTHDRILCPVEAAISIISRAIILHVPPLEPLGVYKGFKGSKFLLLKSREVIKVMRQAVLDAYPDPSHYLRQNISRIDAHSNRVTAAVALANAGMTTDEIAFRLRWKPESVDHYLRDCSRAIGRLSDAVLKGSAMI
jgi:hypothetical protein